MSELKRLYDGGKEMRVAGFMSGSGTNLRKILEYERNYDAIKDCPYTVAVIFTDNPKSNAVQIGSQFDVPVIVRDIESFYKARDRNIKDMGLRADFDEETS